MDLFQKDPNHKMLVIARRDLEIAAGITKFSPCEMSCNLESVNDREAKTAVGAIWN